MKNFCTSLLSPFFSDVFLDSSSSSSSPSSSSAASSSSAEGSPEELSECYHLHPEEGDTTRRGRAKEERRWLRGVDGFWIKAAGAFLLTVGFACLLWRWATIPQQKWNALSNSNAVELTAKKKNVLAKKNHVAGLCQQPDYSKKALKMDYEMSYFGVLADTKGQKKFEASDVTVVDSSFYVVCDNSWAVSRLDRRLLPASDRSFQIGTPQIHGRDDSGWEAIAYHSTTKHFFVVREAVRHGRHFHSHVMELSLEDDVYREVETCPCEFVFHSGNKGFEGLVLLPSRGKDLKEVFLLALCEGNFCEGGGKGKQRGNGRMVLMRKAYGEDKSCIWQTVKMLKLPSEVFFEDYSAAALYGNSLAIVSQQDSELWIGRIEISGREDGPVAVDDQSLHELSIPPGGKTFFFPRDGDCNVVYCNIEGVSFLNDRMIVAVSDQMKTGGKQDFRCLQKDQSVHVFSLPPSAVTEADRTPKEAETQTSRKPIGDDDSKGDPTRREA